jgi:cytochrome c biogenesis protein CcmG, thiol:disulfide interchange protein DsbE
MGETPTTDGTGTPPPSDRRSGTVERPSPAARRRRRVVRLGCAVAAAIAVTLITAAAQGGTTLDPSALREGDGAAAPEFQLEDLRDPKETIDLAGFAGRPVVLNFWASWCVPCRSEMPALQAAHQRLADRVVFLGVNHQDSRTAAIDLLDETGVTYPSGRDPGGEVAASYGLYGLPATVFIGPDGELLATRTGEISETELDQTVTELFGR